MKIAKEINTGDLFYAYKRPYDILTDQAIKESVEYIKKFKKTAMFADHGWWDIALSKINKNGLHLEFGVYTGTSINYFSNVLPDITWYGFDSFLGMQEDWKGGWFGKGYLNLNNKIPNLNKNVKIIKGWFKDTLPKFLKNKKDHISFMHIDCDTYESTRDIFNCIDRKRFNKGCIILFDEYMGYINWQENEYKAWQEYVKKHKIKYKYVAFGERQALIEII
tara:strand:+ start:4514 stop:5176 length:663 start_codon:yes stop_codon:yes gene_type:complete